MFVGSNPVTRFVQDTIPFIAGERYCEDHFLEQKSGASDVPKRT